MSAGASAGAAAAAVARARAMREEEQEMTGYSPAEIAEGWEFKILRSATSRFKDPAYLKSCLDDEAKAGWMLLEKFDNSRVRLKRPTSARERDAVLGFDPYRTHVGMTESQLGLSIALGALSLIAIAILIVLIVR
jgi:hypothetical protein